MISFLRYTFHFINTLLQLLALAPNVPGYAYLESSNGGPAATVKQTEAESQLGEVEKIPQKVVVQAGESEKGCNYSLTCELCQKENKTLQALYTHVIVHIRVELERKVKDLMEGLQCKVCFYLLILSYLTFKVCFDLLIIK